MVRQKEFEELFNAAKETLKTGQKAKLQSAVDRIDKALKKRAPATK